MGEAEAVDTPAHGDSERWKERCERGGRKTTERHPRPKHAAATGQPPEPDAWPGGCLLYTSDAADDM
eukprot:15175209-Alexandrium_andersonii.AAC.1